MDRASKESFVSKVKESIEASPGALFLDYTGMTVNDINAVRRKFQEAGITYQVVKNTLMARACADTPYAGISQLLKGSPTGVVLGGEDAVSAAKLTFELLKDYEALKVKGGILDDAALDAKQAEALSKMPSRAELQAKIVGQALSPGANLAGQLKGPAGRILGAIEQMVETKENG